MRISAPMATPRFASTLQTTAASAGVQHASTTAFSAKPNETIPTKTDIFKAVVPPWPLVLAGAGAGLLGALTKIVRR